MMKPFEDVSVFFLRIIVLNGDRVFDDHASDRGLWIRHGIQRLTAASARVEDVNENEFRLLARLLQRSVQIVQPLNHGLIFPYNRKPKIAIRIIRSTDTAAALRLLQFVRNVTWLGSVYAGRSHHGGHCFAGVRANGHTRTGSIFISYFLTIAGTLGNTDAASCAWWRIHHLRFPNRRHQ